MIGGYTKAQARERKQRIDRSMARVEDQLGTMHRQVPDTSSLDYEHLLEPLREYAEALKATVDRRTQT